MYIEPTTNIRLLSGVPLDNSYRNTIAFYTNAQQNSYLLSKQKYNLGNYSYVRVSNGTARVGINANDLYDCNYMMFNNINFGNKWFFAFITDIEYINNTTSLIHFELDVMQTWFFDITYKECFVEREHPKSDNIGEHILPEPVNVGEVIFNDRNEIIPNLTRMICIVLVSDTQFGTGSLVDGVFSGCSVHAFKIESNYIDSLKNFIAGYTDSPESIVAIYMCPYFNANGAVDDSGTILSYNAKPARATASSYQINDTYTLGGYKPKNKKLYTYPYNYFYVDNGSGSSLVMRYEFCNNLIPQFRVAGTVTPPAQCQLRPVNYKGILQGSDQFSGALMSESLTLNNYPQCSFIIDAFRAWLAQEAVPSVLSMGANTVGSLASGGGLTSVAGNAFSSVTNLVSQGYKASIAADITRGNTNNGSVNCAMGEQTFYGSRVSVNAKDAKMIDDYFTVYGYAVNTVKIPDIYSRPHWTYIKCSNALIVGKCPSTDIARIESILNNGITFWKNGDEVGNYSLDNSPE